MDNNNSYLAIAIKAAVLAGKEIISVYGTNGGVEFKSDNSPLTIADRQSHDKIIETLMKAGLPVLSEEGKAIEYSERKHWRLFWMVDPLDGTKEFIKKNGEFTVNIALIGDGIPRLGVVYAPVMDTLYFSSIEVGSYKLTNPLSELVAAVSEENFLTELINRSHKLPGNKNGKTFTIVASRSHLTPETEQFINELKIKHGTIEFISKGSSLKICLVAEGVADIYPRLAPTMEWDTAAGHAVVLYSGKTVNLYRNNEPMTYNKENLLNEWFVVN